MFTVMHCNMFRIHCLIIALTGERLNVVPDEEQVGTVAECDGGMDVGGYLVDWLSQTEPDEDEYEIEISEKETETSGSLPANLFASN